MHKSTSVSMMSSLVVIDCTPGLSVKEREVENARALSYAAKVSHSKKRAKKLALQGLKLDVVDAQCGQLIRYQHKHSHTIPERRRVALSTTSSRTTSRNEETEPQKQDQSGQQSEYRDLDLSLASADTWPDSSESGIWRMEVQGSVAIPDEEYDTAKVNSHNLQLKVDQYVGDLLFHNDFGCFRGMRTDPFGFVPTHTSVAVDYYAKTIVPNYAAIWTIFNVNSMAPHGLFELLQQEVCTLAMVLPPKIITDGSWYPGKPTSEVFVKGYNLALSRVRKYLAQRGGRADAAVLMAVNGLAILAGAMGDITAFKVHMQSLAPLVRSAGGFDNFGRFHFVKALLLQWETQWAFQPQFRAAIFSEFRPQYNAYFPPVPFFPHISKLVARLPTGFQSLAERRQLSLRSIEVLARCVVASSGGLRIDPRDQFHPETRRYSDFFEACPCLAPWDGTTPQPALEKLIMQALILYCVHTWSPLRFSWGLYRGIRTDLTAEVNRYLSANNNLEDVVVWVCLNLIDSWASDDSKRGLSPEGRDLVKCLRHTQDVVDDTETTLCRLQSFFTNKRFEVRCLSYLATVVT